MTREIGLTGGIGGGKSTVAKIFETFGYAVYYADDRARALYTESEDVRRQVVELFGEKIYAGDGSLDRKALAEIVFGDREKLGKLNAIVHPATLRDFERWRDNLLAGGYGRAFLLKEAAILFEAGTWRDLDGIVTVYAPKSERIARVCKRDDTTPEQVRSRMENQWPEADKLARADFIVFNDGVHHVIPQVKAAIHHLRGL